MSDSKLNYLFREIKSDLLELYEAGGQYRKVLNEIILGEPDENVLYNDYKVQIEKLTDNNDALINQMKELL